MSVRDWWQEMFELPPWQAVQLGWESLEDTDNLPTPDVIAAEIVDDLEAALAQFTEIAATLPKPT